MNNIELIPYGKENRISKEEISEKLNISYKEVTNIITKLRKSYTIFSDTTLGGYWRSSSEKELVDFIRECNSKCQSYNDMIDIAFQEIDDIRERKNK